MLAHALEQISLLHAQVAGDSGLVDRMFDKDLIVPVLAVVCGSLIAIVAITFTTVRTILVSRGKEQSRRELAAYVAEGTLDADKAIALLEAGKPAWEKGGAKGCC